VLNNNFLYSHYSLPQKLQRPGFLPAIVLTEFAKILPSSESIDAAGSWMDDESERNWHLQYKMAA